MKSWVKGLVLTFLVIGVGSVGAGTIIVQNPSFEDFILSDGDFTPHGDGLNGEGWVADPSGDLVGIFNPNGQFAEGGGASDGVNIGYSQGPMISQVLSDVLIAGSLYELNVDIGVANNEPFGGYGVQLLAGGDLLAEDNNTLSIGVGTFVTSTVTFIAFPGIPQLGQPLEIRLLFLSLGVETSYDNVRLEEFNSIPEPASLLLLTVSTLAFPFSKRLFRF